MTREGRSLPAPFTADGPFLAAILDALDDIRDLLADRLPAHRGEPVRVEEPAPAATPGTAVPLREPAPGGPPEADDEKPVEVTEPAPDRPPLPDPPPRAGRGSSLDAWQRWAGLAAVAVEDDMTRDDIIAACELAGVLAPK